MPVRRSGKRLLRHGRRGQTTAAQRLGASDAIDSAKRAGLCYVHDTLAGLRRRRCGTGFVYENAQGQIVRDPEALARIRSLVIPPAWNDVWICPNAKGHLQAVGRDAKGRKQYRYHPRWREVRDDAKYDHLIAFGQALTRVRQRTERDLGRSGLVREKVLATVVRLLDSAHLRVGNEEYVRNGAFGLTTMRAHHAEVNGSRIHFEFPGKHRVNQAVDVADRRLARVVKQCQDLPGQELFQYVDKDGGSSTVTSTDVNDYLRQITGDDFTAKDFRTWAGTVLAALALQQHDRPRSKTRAKRNIVRAIDEVAAHLGNTRAVCRKCYIHPAVLDVYLDGSLGRSLNRHGRKKPSGALTGLKPEEAALLGLLEERRRRETGRSVARAC